MSDLSDKRGKKQFLFFCLVAVFIGVCSVSILDQSDSFFAELPMLFNFFLGFISVVVPAFAVMLPTPEE